MTGSAELLRFVYRKSRQFSWRVNLSLWAEGWVRALVGWIPGLEGFAIRNVVYRAIFKKIDGFCYIMPGVFFTEAHNIELGPRVGINSGCNFGGRGGLRIGADCQFGPNVCVVTSGHDFHDPTRPIIEQGHTDGPVIIGRDVWVGAGAVILPNTHLGDGTIVGAGAVVTGDTEPNSIVAGVPARKIGQRS